MPFAQLSLAGLAGSILAIVSSFFTVSAPPVTSPNPTQACSRPCFSGSRLSKTLTVAADSATADFNNDGFPDIAIRGGFSGPLSIQFGMGNGLFGDPQLIDPELTGFSLLAGDFNNDGTIDLFTPGKLFFGDGAGHFSQSSPFSLSPNATSYLSGDFDGDDKLDVVAWNFSSGNYQVFYGDGSGQFGDPLTVNFSSAASSLEVADLNGDGIQDFAVVVSNGAAIAVAFGNGDRTFQTPVSYSLGGSITVSVIASGDIDSDGDRDLVATGGPIASSTSYRAVLLNNGTGTFTVQTSTVAPTFGQSRAKLVDINSDGKLDLVNNEAFFMSVSLGNGDGTFQIKRTFPGVIGTGKLFFEDFTGDGIRDLACASGSVNSFTVYPNDAGGNLGIRQLNIEDDFFPTSVVSADFNEDGKPDVLWTNDQLNMKVALGDGSSGFASITTLAAPKVPRAAVTADINHDGHQDIFLIGQNTGESGAVALIAYGNGNGTFQPFFTAFGVAPQAATHPLLADLNGDGFVDMVLRDGNTSRVVITQNTGNGSFIFRGSLDIGSTIGAAAAGDFDGDGTTDLAILSGGVDIFLNRGDWNNWDNAGFFPAGNANANLITGDFNHDGRLDLAAAVTSGTSTGAPPGKIDILLGVGEGGFGAPREYAVGYGPNSMGIADFDGDGNTDIAVSNSGSGVNGDTRVAVLYGDGSGLFPNVNFSEAATQPRDLIAADFNSDGKPDVAVVDYNYAFLDLLLNDCLPAPVASLPTITANPDISINEGDTTETTSNLTVTLSTSSASAVRVKYYTAPQNGLVSFLQDGLTEARARSDYMPTSGEIVFLPGETSKTITVAVSPDLIDEYDEKFNVYLTNATNATIADNRTVVTIVDNDAPPVVTIGNISAPEGNSGTTPFNLPVTLSAASGKPVTVAFQTGGGTATANQDYVLSQGVLTIPAGQLSAQLTVPINGDLTLEPDETFFAEISDPTNAVIGSNARGMATIQNDDVGGTVQFSSATYTTPETVSGVNVTVTRSGGNAGGVRVKFRTSAGTAQPGQDYTETATTIIFGDNETSKNVFIPITFDQLDEPDETVNLFLEGGSGVAVGDPSTAVLTILGTSGQPDLSVTDASVTEGDNGIATLQFILRLSKPTQRQVSVDFSTADGSAKAGSDYALTSGTAVFVPGMTRQTVSVPVYGDFLPESDETLLLNLSNAVNANLVDNQAIGRIINDEISSTSTVRLVSIDRTNTSSGNSDSYDPYLSRDGKVAVFESYASNLASTDTNGFRDIYARHLDTLRTELVSVNRFGTGAANGGAVKPIISSNGRFVAFNSGSSDLTVEGVAAPGSVFVRDLQTGQTRIVSVTTTGAPADGDVTAISGDGRYVVFQSRDQNLTSIPDTQGFLDVFVRDMQANVTYLASANAAGNGPGDTDSGNVGGLEKNVAISDDGRYILFTSAATNLVSATAGGGVNVFVRDLQTQTTAPVSVDSAGSTLVGGTGNSISDDGHYVAFTSASSSIVANDSNGLGDVFRRDMQTGVTELVSVNTSGASGGDRQSNSGVLSADGRYLAFLSDASNLTSTSISATQVYRRDMTTHVTAIASPNSAGTAGGDGFSSKPHISADGQTIIFTSVSDDLVAGVDLNRLADIYLRDLSTGKTKLVSVNEAGTAAGNLGAVDGSISGDGNIVGFSSASSNMLAIDNNGFVPDAFVFIKNLPPPPISDFDGDGKTDLGVFRPGTSVWYVLNSHDRSLRAQQFGLGTDIPVARDYDGDGKTDIAMFRQGVWYVLNSHDNSLVTYAFGQSGDIPVPEDYDGDRKADFAVYRQGTWLVRETSDGNVMTQHFGIATDIPTVADYDGDGRADIAVYRDGVWYILRSSDFSVGIIPFGLAGDRPVQGDFDGDRKADLAVYRPSNGAWYITNSSNGSFRAQQFGLSTDIPLRADFDGDGKADISVFRNGSWYIIQSSNQALNVQQFGIANDVPLSK